MIAGYNGHVAEHPEFASNGTVHIIGFSLGGICAYDILSEQWEPEDGVPPWEEELPEEVTETSGPLLRRLDVTVPKLPFRVKSLFTCGSPIGAQRVRGSHHPFSVLFPPH
ncbi:hypothetical protein BC937DRAFT_94103 [Endogone sp. FLAS-F59071]|nr:hypothetical protein BC937DRAFT_94103 [Endogone sp. FLAS-F59071]|eukprot:RUS14253.1 hypothetical protein BC937DRAFT_94103 [Endogone sp. FLAS-F59071]